MNGAESLVRTLVGGGVNVCFANPGTSEMHFVAALDRVDGMRCVLGLFEGVVTGAADGYARMTGNPAATLLHLGPGMANGLANIHNANKASTPMVNIVGDHATYHRRYDAPLTTDIETAAKPFSRWVKTSPDAKSVAADGAAAIIAARTPPGQIATLILPADTAWNEGSGPANVSSAAQPAPVSSVAVTEAARVLRSGEPCLLLVTGRALRQEGLDLAGRITAKTGARLIAQGSNARTQPGRPADRRHFRHTLALVDLQSGAAPERSISSTGKGARTATTDPAFTYYELPCGHEGMLDMPDGLHRILVATADPVKCAIPLRRDHQANHHCPGASRRYRALFHELFARGWRNPADPVRIPACANCGSPSGMVDGARKPCRGIRCAQLTHFNSSITAFAALRSAVSNPSLNR